MLLLSVLVGRFGDSNSLGMLLLFGPRWLLLLPWLVLLPLAFLAHRRAVVVPVALISVLVTALGVSRFEIPSPWRNAGSGLTLRVVTYNTDRVPLNIASDLARWQAQLVLLQDCKSVVGEGIASLAHREELYTYRDAEFCVASQLPISNVERMPADAREGRALRFNTRWDGVDVRVGVVHLPTPRDALWAARNGNTSLLERSVRVRSSASRFASAWMREGWPGALIVAGDFNLPVESRSLREDWPGMTNAFSTAGMGFGHTMYAGRHRVRIDHVLVSREFSVARADVRTGYPSEHQPVVVELERLP